MSPPRKSRPRSRAGKTMAVLAASLVAALGIQYGLDYLLRGRLRG